jgi:hypothetical protein
MNSIALGNNAIQYRDQTFRDDSDTLLELETKFVRELAEGKQYRPKRSGSPKRRKMPKAARPGCGIAGRCKRRWTW